jgi:hypothetical protein
VNTGKSYGRNDAVSIRNTATGEVQNVKYKKGRTAIGQGLGNYRAIIDVLEHNHKTDSKE